eukprot:TRINITY_DN86655_c0_g1_i1.p1 TRINITY_DN86655_c0_g1~~TRINITY_DN86655_c0_g1_i1.p1  ORF type:complete len:208 (+),score=37.32 TRINITY_DN86655_c0_g1_i1:25-648(+)
MVYFWTLSSDPSLVCYSGKNENENDDLIKWGWPEDVWFHVEPHSSAHIYIRLPPPRTIDDLPIDVIEEAAQLCKANSIAGCKLNDVKVVYTPWTNLKKTAAMKEGQVGFHSDKAVKYTIVAKKKNAVINKLEKSKQEKFPDLQAEREERDRQERHEKKMELVAEKAAEKARQEEYKKTQELREYKTLQTEDLMTSNQDNEGLEDDFM